MGGTLSDYYTVPQDVKLSWAHLVGDLQTAAQGHGGEEMTFSIVVRDGLVREIVEPTYRRREPRGAQVNQESRLWWAVVRRLQSVGNGRAVLIEMSIDLDLNDNPTTWREPVVRRVEPNGRTR